MTKVTKEMINAAHDVTMKSNLMLGHGLLEKIYLAMDSQRTWVGLTDEQIKVMWRCSKIYGTNEEKALALARAIEAAHGIKE